MEKKEKRHFRRRFVARGPDSISVRFGPFRFRVCFPSRYLSGQPDNSNRVPSDSRTLVATGRKEISRRGIVWKGSFNPVQSQP